jgi:predicted metal-dependent hydrolase
MQEYESGMVFEKIPDAVIEQQRDLEATQRRMEREYRALREKEELYRILGNRTKNKEILQIATQTRKKAVALRKNYEAFSRKHEITFYPNRLQIVAGENRYVRTVGKKDAFAKEALKMKNEA